MKSVKNALLNLFACIPVSVVLALVLMVVVAAMVCGVYVAFTFFAN